MRLPEDLQVYADRNTDVWITETRDGRWALVRGQAWANREPSILILPDADALARWLGLRAS